MVISSLGVPDARSKHYEARQGSSPRINGEPNALAAREEFRRRCAQATNQAQ